jgi:cell division protein FtsA
VNVSANINGRIVKNDDVMRLLSLSDNENNVSEIIHAIPIMFNIDSLGVVKDPVGMVANQLSMSINIVSVPKSQLNNVMLCLSRCHLEVTGIVAASYASGLCVQNEHDISISQIVVDFGAGTTSIAFFYNGIFCGSKTIPLGGQNITKDIAYGLNISMASAERIKTLHGAAFVSIDDEREMVLVPVMEDDNVIDLQQIFKSMLNQIIQSRVEEILNAVKKEIEGSIFKNDFSKSPIIITGGGSQLTGIRDFATGVLNRKIILKKTNNFHTDASVQIENDFAVAIGMIKFAQITNTSAIKQRKSNYQNEKIGFLKKTLFWIENNL